MAELKPSDVHKKGRRYTRQEKLQALERLAFYAGNERAVEDELGVSHVTVGRWRVKYAKDYREIVGRLEKHYAEQLDEERRFALDLLHKALGVKWSALSKESQAYYIKLSDIARAFEVLDRAVLVCREVSDANQPDDETTTESRADVDAILGEGPEDSTD